MCLEPARSIWILPGVLVDYMASNSPIICEHVDCRGHARKHWFKKGLKDATSVYYYYCYYYYFEGATIYSNRY
jgi:hypothetical protein